MSPAPLAVVDTETIGLNAENHDIFEVALLLVDEDGNEEARHTWWVKPQALWLADPYALAMTNFYERCPPLDGEEGWTDHEAFARDFARLTARRHLVGAVPSFDAERLDRLLRRHRVAPAWHYHLVDVEALAAGKLGLEPPWDSRSLAELCGVHVDDSTKHTAMGDVLWAWGIYKAVMDPAWQTMPPPWMADEIVTQEDADRVIDEAKARETAKPKRRRSQAAPPAATEPEPEAEPEPPAAAEPVTEPEPPVTPPAEVTEPAEPVTPPEPEPEPAPDDWDTGVISAVPAKKQPPTAPADEQPPTEPVAEPRPQGMPGPDEQLPCEECGELTEPSAGDGQPSQAQLSWIRYRKVLDRKCFVARG